MTFFLFTFFYLLTFYYLFFTFFLFFKSFFKNLFTFFTLLRFVRFFAPSTLITLFYYSFFSFRILLLFSLLPFMSRNLSTHGRTLRITLCSNGRTLHIISAHAPTDCADPVDKDAFWSQLDLHLSRSSSGTCLICMQQLDPFCVWGEHWSCRPSPGI